MPVPGIGTLWQVGDGATPTENFTTIAGAGDIQIADKVKSVDGTSQDSPGHQVQMFPVINDAVVIKVPLFLDPLDSGQRQLRTDMHSFTVRHYRLVTPTSPQTKDIYTAYPDDLSPSYPVANLMKMAASFTCTAAPQFNVP